jgi:hypothetical protein
MDFKNLSKDLDKINYFKNVAYATSKACLKAFDSEDLDEAEEKCLQKQSINLHYILWKDQLEHYAVVGRPYTSF